MLAGRRKSTEIQQTLPRVGVNTPKSNGHELEKTLGKPKMHLRSRCGAAWKGRLGLARNLRIGQAGSIAQPVAQEAEGAFLSGTLWPGKATICLNNPKRQLEVSPLP